MPDDVCGRQNNGSPEMSRSEYLEPVSMLPYVEKGTVIKLKIFDRWADYSGLSVFLMRKRGRQEWRKRETTVEAEVKVM